MNGKSRRIDCLFLLAGRNINDTEVLVLVLLLIRLLEFAKVQVWAEAVLICHTNCVLQRGGGWFGSAKAQCGVCMFPENDHA